MGTRAVAHPTRTHVAPFTVLQIPKRNRYFTKGVSFVVQLPPGQSLTSIARPLPPDLPSLPMPVDPASLSVVTYPHPALRKRAKPIDKITDEVRAVAKRMIELMRQEEGIGLAANQVALPWRMFAADVPHSDNAKDDRSLNTDPISATRGPVVFINPVLSEPKRDLIPVDEGCLSLPDIRGEVRRPSEITITYTDLEGERTTLRAGGLLARCWQHEVDHLDGALIIDRMVPIDRMKNRAAIKDLEEQFESEKPL